jgi:tetratricopeptide (TPR) repeat protein
MKAVLLSLISLGLAAQAPDLAALGQQARTALQAGRFDDAAGLYRKMIAQLPNVGGLRLNLGLALFQAGKPREAAVELRAALKLEPGLTPAATMLGLCHAKLGEPLAAIPLLERSLKAEPGNAVVLLELADSYFSAGRFAAAVDHFRKLTALQPANPVGWRGLGLSLMEQSQMLFGQLPPGSAEALTLLARAKLMAEEPKAAYSYLRQALDRNPGFGPAHGLLAELYVKTGHADWAEAARAKAAPGTGRYAEIVAAGEESLAALGRLAALGPSAELYETEAEAARARGAYPEAVEAWRKAVAQRPRDARLERGLARALFAARLFDEAVPLLARHGLGHELGEALLESGRAAEAIPHLVKLRTPAAQAALGRAYLATDQPGLAVGPLRAALATDTDGSLHFQLARALQRTGAAAQAREMDRLSAELRRKKAAQAEALAAIEIGPGK